MQIQAMQSQAMQIQAMQIQAMKIIPDVTGRARYSGTSFVVTAHRPPREPVFSSISPRRPQDVVAHEKEV